MKTATGHCKYCEQFRTIQVPDDWTQEQINEEVTRKCNCEEAMAEEETRRVAAYATGEIERFFEDRGMDAFESILKAAVEPIAKKNISKISINSDGYTATMKRTGSGVSITLKHTTEEKTAT